MERKNKLPMNKTIILLSICLMALTTSCGTSKSFTATAPACVEMATPFRIIYTATIVEANTAGIANTDAQLDRVKDFSAQQFSKYDMHRNYATQTREVQIIEAHLHTILTYTYSLIPQTKGVFTIPPATITIDNRKYKSNKLKIKVTNNE
jgi:hypothetical protein